MTTNLLNQIQTERSSYETRRLTMADGFETTLHIAKFSKDSFKPKLVDFDKPTQLVKWCKENNKAHAMVGGFFLRSSGLPLGDIFISGEKKESEAIKYPGAARRGSLQISKMGEVAIGPRYEFDGSEKHDFIQAGPLLVKNNRIIVANEGEDVEGISETAGEQFDSDITIGRYPRSAIAVNDTHIISAVCDGRTDTEAGLTLGELADAMQEVGAVDALNLDGGSSSTLVYDFEMKNTSNGGEFFEGVVFEDGRPIYNAIAFEQA